MMQCSYLVFLAVRAHLLAHSHLAPPVVRLGQRVLELPAYRIQLKFKTNTNDRNIYKDTVPRTIEVTSVLAGV